MLVERTYIPPFYIVVIEYASYFKLDYKYNIQNDFTDLFESIRKHDGYAYAVIKKVYDIEKSLESISPPKKVKGVIKDPWETKRTELQSEQKENILACIDLFKNKNIPIDKLIIHK